MNYVIFTVLQFVLWTAFYATTGLLKDEMSIVVIFAISAVITMTMLAMTINGRNK